MPRHFPRSSRVLVALGVALVAAVSLLMGPGQPANAQLAPGGGGGGAIGPTATATATASPAPSVRHGHGHGHCHSFRNSDIDCDEQDPDPAVRWVSPVVAVRDDDLV